MEKGQLPYQEDQGSSECPWQRKRGERIERPSLLAELRLEPRTPASLWEDQTGKPRGSLEGVSPNPHLMRERVWRICALLWCSAEAQVGASPLLGDSRGTWLRVRQPQESGWPCLCLPGLLCSPLPILALWVSLPIPGWGWPEPPSSPFPEAQPLNQADNPLF